MHAGIKGERNAFSILSGTWTGPVARGPLLFFSQREQVNRFASGTAGCPEAGIMGSRKKVNLVLRDPLGKDFCE